MMKNELGAAMIALAMGLSLSACSDAADGAGDPVENTSEAGDNPLFETIGQIDEASMAHDLIEQAGLQDTFVGVGAYTLFLPTNNAFAALPDEDLERLQTEEGRPELIATLRRHIAVGAIARADLDNALEENGGAIELASVADTPIGIRTRDGAVVLGEGDDAAQLTDTAEAASNGVVYLIDGLIPPDS